MNYRIKTEKDNIVVHTYRGYNKFFVSKVYTKNSKKSCIESQILESAEEAIDMHRFLCMKHLLKEKV